MSAISTAIGSERKARVSGYKIKKGFFDNVTPNLPQVIAILGEANMANQASLNLTKKEIISANEAGEIYGFGSPIHQMMRILRPKNGPGVGGIPTIVYPQASSLSALPHNINLKITGTATENCTHNLIVNGRKSIDGQNYSFTIIKGDSPEEIVSKIILAVNGVLSSPLISSSNPLDEDSVTLKTKWAGETAEGVQIEVDNNGFDAGLTYYITLNEASAGVVSIESALEQFESDWNTIVLNPYSFSKENVRHLDELEAFNGFPDDDQPTGRYEARVFKPFVSLFGMTALSSLHYLNVTATADRINQVTNVLCPAPNSMGFNCEAAANACVLYARMAQDNPELDISGKSYPDMPIPRDGIIGDMSDYNVRDNLVKKGCSTVILENGKYQVQDFVTTYHPEGETPLQYAYPRNLNIDWNIKDGYGILEKRNVKDHVLVMDNQVTDVAKSVKPKQWKAVLYDYFADLAVRALIKDPDFSKESLKVEVDAVNVDRFNTFFRYRRTGVARIQSTDAEAGF